MAAYDVHDAIRERAMKFTVTSGAGVTEVIDRPASARAALELVLALLGRTRTDFRIFDEDGRRRSPADLCRLAADEVAMLPDESGAELLSQSKATPPARLLQSNRRDLVATVSLAEARPATYFMRQQNICDTQIAVSDGEIAADFLVVEHVRLLGGVAHLFDRDRIEVGEKGFARPAYGRINHPLKQHRV